MTTMVDDLKYPDLSPAAGVGVKLYVLAPGPTDEALVTGSDFTIISTSMLWTDETGHLAVDLTPTDDLTPEGAVYQLQYPHRHRRNASEVTYNPIFTVPAEDEAEHWVGDHLTDPPGALATSALGAETAARIAADDDLQTAIDGKEPSGAYRPGGTDVAVADGGTGASSAAAARTNLGLGTAAVEDVDDLPVSAAQQAALDAKTPKSAVMVNLLDYGSVGTLDDVATFQAAVDHVFATYGRGAVWVPRRPAGGFYRTLRPIFLPDNVVLELEAGARIRNECPTSSWDSVVVVMGTYQGHGSAGYANLDTGWTVGAITRPANSATMQTPAQAANLAAGDLVYIVDPASLNGSYYNKAESNIVRSSNSGTGIVVFEHPLRFNYAAGTYVRKLGRVGAPSGLATGIDGSGAYAVRGAGIAGHGSIEQAQTGYKAIHVGGAFECFTEPGIVIEGWTGIVGNPCCSNTFKARRIAYNGQSAVELAYGTNGNLIEVELFERTGDTDPTGTFRYALSIGVEDGGADNTVRFGETREFTANAGNQGLIGLHGDRDRIFRHRLLSNGASGSAGIVGVGPDSEIRECGVEGAKTVGISGTGLGVKLVDNDVRSVPSGSGGISVAAAAGPALVEGNNVGDPSGRVSQDTITISSTTATQRNNTAVNFGWRGFRSTANSDYSGATYASLADVSVQIVPGAYLQRGRIVKAFASGRIASSSSAGTKRLQWVWAGIVVADLNIPDGYSGPFELEAICFAQENPPGGVGYVCRSRLRMTSGETLGAPVAVGGTFLTDTAMRLKVQSVNAASVVSVRAQLISIEEPQLSAG